jgi:hypothetical protein
MEVERGDYQHKNRKSNDGNGEDPSLNSAGNSISEQCDDIERKAAKLVLDDSSGSDSFDMSHRES